MISAQKETLINMPPYQKAHEKMMAKETSKMMKTIGRMFVNQIPKSFSAQTVGKFADAQSGNYSAVLLAMTKKLKRKLKSRYSDQRIEKMARDILQKSRITNGNALYIQAEAVSGIPVKTLLMQEGLNPQFNALYAETAEWIKKLRDDHLIAINNNTLRMMTEGKGVDDIVTELVKSNTVAVGKANAVARQQVASFNGLASKIRAQKLGITEAIWVTAKDERVRHSHQDRHGKRYNLSEGLYSSIDGKHLHVGTDFGCRCRAKMVIPVEAGTL